MSDIAIGCHRYVIYIILIDLGSSDHRDRPCQYKSELKVVRCSWLPVVLRSNLDNEESNQMSKLNYYNSNPYYTASLQPVRLDRIFSLPDI